MTEVVNGQVKKTRIHFVNATAHGPNGDVYFHFWEPLGKKWLRSTWSNFKRHITKSSALNDEENVSKQFPPRENYINYFVQPVVNLTKQSDFFTAPFSRISVCAKTKKNVVDTAQLPGNEKRRKPAVKNMIRKGGGQKRKKANADDVCSDDEVAIVLPQEPSPKKMQKKIAKPKNHALSANIRA